MKLIKVKGHATQDMVEQGKVKAEDKEGNDKADEQANQAVKLYSTEAIKTGAAYMGRHMRYTKMVEELHTSFIEAILKRNELEQKARKREKPYQTATIKPELSTSEQPNQATKPHSKPATLGK